MFIVVNHFRAVLLLDEADAFLVERTSEAKAHDSTVTTFLHTLDSLRGIFFLTTNREMVFDRASMSRIQMEISYPELIPEFRRTNWKTQFCMAQKPVEITENELGKLAAMSLDGRQIGNIVYLAGLLPAVDSQSICWKHLENAANAKREYGKVWKVPLNVGWLDDYVRGLYGRARVDFVRSFRRVRRRPKV